MSVRGNSMTTKEICILVVIDDLISYNIVSRILQFCTYEVLSTGKADDVFKALQERKEHVSSVFTNVHRLSSEGFTILQNIKNRLNLQTILMSPDGEKVDLPEKGSSFEAYIIKFLNVNDVKNLLHSASEIEKMEKLDSRSTEGNTITPTNDDVSRVNYKQRREESFEENDDVSRVNYKRRREESFEENDEESEDGRDDGPSKKKSRMVWTTEMHQKFLEAIEILGYEKAFPKKIVEVMDVPGLTRENVASHLQKYRLCLKRTNDSDPISLYGMNQITTVKRQCLPSGVSPFLSKPYGNSYLGRNHYGMYVQPPLKRTVPDVLYASATKYPRSCQTDDMYSQRINGNGNMNNQYGYSPNLVLRNNFRVYNDTKKNVLMNIGGRSSVDANMTSESDPSTSFLGFRLTKDGKSVEVGGKCISTNNQTTGSETLPKTVANGNTSQLANESQTPLLSVEDYGYTSLLSVEDFGYSEDNLIQPTPLSANCNLTQEPSLGLSSLLENEQINNYTLTPPENEYKNQLSPTPFSANCNLAAEPFPEQSSILENAQINNYSLTPPENEYINQYSSTPPDIIPENQSLLPHYQAVQAPDGISPTKSSTPDINSLEQQLFMPLQVSGNTLASPSSMPLDSIFDQLPSPLPFEVLNNEFSAQPSIISGDNVIHQYQHSVPSVSNSADVDIFQHIPTPPTRESPPPSLTSTRDELEDILIGIGDDFWNNDIDDIINNINN